MLVMIVSPRVTHSLIDFDFDALVTWVAERHFQKAALDDLALTASERHVRQMAYPVEVAVTAVLAQIAFGQRFQIATGLS